MPAKRKTKADRLREQFSKMYAVGKAGNHLTDVDVAEFIGLKSVNSLTARKKDPTRITLGELSKMTVLLGWNEEDVIKLIKM